MDRMIVETVRYNYEIVAFHSMTFLFMYPVQNRVRFNNFIIL